MLWLIFSVAAGLLFGVVDLTGKFIMDKEIKNDRLASGMAGLGIFSVFIFLSVLFGNVNLSKITIPAIAGGIFYSISMFFYYSGIKREEVSRFSMTLSLTTVFVVIFAFLFLGETFSLIVYIGIIMTILGSLFISLEDPMESLTSFESIAGLGLAVLATLFFAFREISFKFAFNQTTFWNGVLWAGLSGITVSLVLLISSRQNIVKKNVSGIKNLYVVGLLSGIAFVLFARAISLGPVSLASAILRVKALIIFSGSIALTRTRPDIIEEKWDRFTFTQKTVAGIVIIIGVLLIQFFS